MAWAQPKATVAREVANMGEVGYLMPRKVSFTLKNTGNEPLHINEVIPSCGCVSVEWTREPVAPGGEGLITTEYDARMLGVFQKDLEVYTNASEQPFYLHLQGRVVAKLSDYSGDFPIDLGNVRMNVDNIEFDDVNRGRPSCGRTADCEYESCELSPATDAPAALSHRTISAGSAERRTYRQDSPDPGQ